MWRRKGGREREMRVEEEEVSERRGIWGRVGKHRYIDKFRLF